MKRNKSFGKLAVYIICLIIIFTLGRSTFVYHFYNKKEISVPDILMMKEDEAIRELKKLGLKYKVIYSKSGDVQEDYTFLQDPRARQVVKVNREILIWVNKSDSLEIPNIIGKSLIEGRRFLEDLDINIERIDYMPTENIQEDTILSIYPKAGQKVGMGQKISLLVSSKSLTKTSIMPNLIGLEKEEAIKILSQNGLSISLISDAKDPSFAQNVIVATNPQPGEEVNNNTKISIVLNTGIEVDKSITDVIIEEKTNNNDKNNKKVDKKEDIESILDNTLKELEKKENKKAPKEEKNAN